MEHLTYGMTVDPTLSCLENEIVPDSVSPSPILTYSQRFRNKAYDKPLPQSMERIPHTQVPSPREANDKPLPQSKERIPQTQVPSLREDDAQLICSESKKETKLNEALECFTVNKGRFVSVQNYSPEVQVISIESKQKTILKEAPDWFVLNKDNKARPVSVENDSPEVQILGERNFSEKCNELCDMIDQIYNKNLIAESNVQSCQNFDDATPKDKFLADVRDAFG